MCEGELPLNVTEIAKALGHTRVTVEKYLVILERALFGAPT